MPPRFHDLIRSTLGDHGSGQGMDLSIGAWQMPQTKNSADRTARRSVRQPWPLCPRSAMAVTFRQLGGDNR